MSEKKIKEILRITILFLTMMSSGGGFIFPRKIIILILIFYTGINIILYPEILKRINYRLWVFLGTLLFIIIIQSIAFNEYTTSILWVLSNFLPATTIYIFYVKNKFFVSDFVVLSKIFVIQALVSLIFIFLAPQLFQNVDIIDSYGDSRSISHIFFLIYKSVDSAFWDNNLFNLSRLVGFFWEPGILQIYLNLFLIVLLFIRPQKKYWLFLTLVCIVFAQSTTGYILASLILLSFFLKQFTAKKSWVKLVLITSLFAILIYPAYQLITSNLQDKISGDQSGSYYARQADLISGWEIAQQNPIIGIGPNSGKFMKLRKSVKNQGEYSGNEMEDKGTTNGLLNILYAWGFPFCLWYVFALWKQNIFPKARFLIFITLFVSLLSEPISMSPFVLLFIFSGVTKQF